MRIVVFIALAAGFGCTKKNPNLCCVDQADCQAHGIALGSTCDEGLVCRGNQCIAETCSTSAECDQSASFCVSGLCAATCSDDSQCPGFGGSAGSVHCVTGACVACRVGMNDCSGATPICDSGSCRACRDNSECPSQVCAADGTCAAEGEIAYVDPSGSSTSDCSHSSPCSTITRALGLSPPKPYVVIDSGTYMGSGAVVPTGTVSLIGYGPTPPKLTRSSPGPIVSLSANGTNVTLDGLEVSGATSGSNTPGNGIDCGTSSPTVHLRSVTLDKNSGAGLGGLCAQVDAVSTTFSSNGTWGVDIGVNSGSFDRCVVTENTSGGMNLDGGVYTVTNSIIARNQDPSGSLVFGINLYSESPGNRVEFNTIVDNGAGNPGDGLNCNLDASLVSVAFPNNIIARNNAQTHGTVCTYPSSIIVDTDISSLHFKSPDTAPYDYHIGSGSMAIDHATLSTIDHDIDGDRRPLGAGNDVGADEAQ